MRGNLREMPHESPKGYPVDRGQPSNLRLQQGDVCNIVSYKRLEPQDDGGILRVDTSHTQSLAVPYTILQGVSEQRFWKLF